jgi:hypothetical protein
MHSVAADRSLCSSWSAAKYVGLVVLINRVKPGEDSYSHSLRISVGNGFVPVRKSWAYETRRTG